MLLARALAAATIVWMLLLTLAAAYPSGVLADIVFRFSSFICHQQADRSFFWGAAPWPVCARCLGLYAAAPAGALLALAVRMPTDHPSRSRNIFLLCIAAMPTAVTWLAEHAAGVPMSNAVRFAAALPLGAALGWLLVRVTSSVSQYTLQDARRGQAR